MRKISKRIFSIFVALAILIMPMMANVNSVFADADKTINIIHTNDMHGSIDKLGHVKTMKSELNNAILVDAGDAAQGSALATYSNGLDVIKLMNNVGYDVMTYGNHEFDYGTSGAIAIAKEAKFPIISANVFDKNGKLLLEGLQENNNGRYFIKTIDGVKVGFFGITTAETAYKTNPSKLDGTTFASEIEYAKKEVKALQDEGVDLIVALAHVGIDTTSNPTSHKIAEEVDGIDVIIDGHSHSISNKLITNKNNTTHHTLVVQTGTKLANVGVVEVTFSDTNEVVSINGRMVSNTRPDKETPSPLETTYPADATFVSEYNKLNDDLKPILNEKVSKSDTSVFTFNTLDPERRQVSRLEETPGGSLIADAMREEGTEMLSKLGYNLPVVALQNGGGCRENIPAGDITVGNVLDVLPFGNMISIKEVTPDIIYEALENGLSAMTVTEGGYLDITKALGAFSQISGMRAVVDVSKPAGERVIEVYLVNDDGKTETLLNRSDTTTKIALVSNDFEIAGGDGYTMLSNLKHIAEGRLLDIVLQDYIKNHTVDGIFTYAHTSGRVKVKQIEDIQNTGYVNITPDITLEPNKNYNVTIDGITTVAVTTDENGNFVLKQVTNGMHTVSVAGADYYTSTYTNLGLTLIEVTDAPIVEPTPEEPEVIPNVPKTPKPAKPAETGDEINILGYIFMTAITGGYLYIQKKEYN